MRRDKGKIRRGSKTTIEKEKKDTIDAYEIFRAHFSHIVKPEADSPTMPKKVSAMSSEAISDLMFRYSAWRDYTDDITYEATRDYLIYKEKYQYLWDIKMLSVQGATVKERECKVRTMHDVKELRDILIQKEMFLNMLESKYESYTNNLAIISREITRRGNL